jgi:hypothetical protein
VANPVATDTARRRHSKAECELRAHPTLSRYLRDTPTGRPRIDRAKVAREQRLDGRFLISTSDPHLSAEDAALGYKNLLEAERSFRDESCQGARRTRNFSWRSVFVSRIGVSSWMRIVPTSRVADPGQ